MAIFRLDRESGVIHGAKLLGATSRNKRRYSPSAMADVARLAEGRPVRMCHGNNSYGDTVGWVEGLSVEGDGVYGRLHLKPHHPLKEQILWDADKRPTDFGLSIEGAGTTSKPTVDGWREVRNVTAIDFVALVTDPATTVSIRESEEPDETPKGKRKMDLQTLKTDHADLIASLREEFERERAESEETKQARAKLIQERDDALQKLRESEQKVAKFEEEKARELRRAEILKEAETLKVGTISDELMEEYVGMKPETVTAFLTELSKRSPSEAGGSPAGKSKATSSDGMGTTTTTRKRTWFDSGQLTTRS